jgi:hypothetical protein
MSFKYFNDPQYKKVKISYFTYIICKERNDDNVYWTKNYREVGYGQYEFFKFLNIEDESVFTLLNDHIILCNHCLKTYKYNHQCKNCKNFNFKKNFKNFKNVLQELKNPKIYWNIFLKTDYACKYKYYKDLERNAKRVFNKDMYNWYITFYKDMPEYTMVLEKQEVLKLYPNAKNWFDVENYM